MNKLLIGQILDLSETYHMGGISEDLLPAIEECMIYYATKCVQKKLNVMIPMEYYEMKRQHEDCPVEITGKKRFLFFQLSTWRDVHQNQALRGLSSLK